jgi:hypothetical protein
MKYNKRLSLILGFLFAAILFCLSDNFWELPTEKGKEEKPGTSKEANDTSHNKIVNIKN